MNEEVAYGIIMARHRSYPNVQAAARLLRGLAHEPFRTTAVERSSVAVVGAIRATTGMGLAWIEEWAALGAAGRLVRGTRGPGSCPRRIETNG